MEDIKQRSVVSLSELLDPDVCCTELEAAKLLGLSPRTLQSWRVHGAGPPYCKIGRAVRYTRRALLKFQQENTVSSTAEADARLRKAER
jgi:hypothetical protein